MSRPFRKLLSYTLLGTLGLGGCAEKKEAARADEISHAEPIAAVESRPPSEPTTTPVTGTTNGAGLVAAQDAPKGGGGQLSITSGPRGASVTADGRAAGAVGYLGGRQGELSPALDPQGNTESYKKYEPNKMIATAEDNLSTFSVDVDTASYAIIRRKILEGQPVPAAAVRVEELVNYFGYEYEGPTDDRPFAVHMEAAPSPFSPGRHLLRVGVQGKRLGKSERKPAHLTFLVDVSGSMRSADKLPLAQRALRILVDNLNDGDTVSLVTYAGSTRVVLAPTEMDKKAEIYAAIDDLQAGGSTAMASGLELAYQQAQKTLDKQSVSRVIVLTDGDANVGKTSWKEILASIDGYRKEGITLSTIGFGMGNYKDTLMEQLADKGDGNYFYIDGLSEAKKVFQEQLGGTLEVIAQDVKLQVELNRKTVKSYRLIGYENRDIADVDFRNDAVDAGEIGAGHSVTALYEVELVPGATLGDELATVRIRAKKPRVHEAAEWAYPMTGSAMRKSFADASESFRFAVAVMGAAEKLRESPYAKDWSFAKIVEIARGATPAGNAERTEFVSLLAERVKLAAR